jgi:hypothetical protein
MAAVEQGTSHGVHQPGTGTLSLRATQHVELGDLACEPTIVQELGALLAARSISHNGALLVGDEREDEEGAVARQDHPAKADAALTKLLERFPAR